MLRRLFNLLGSAKVAQLLMSVWLALILVWVIPLQFFTGSAEWAKHVVYRTPPFLVLYGALAMATLACMWRRLSSLPRRLAWEKGRRPRGKRYDLELSFDESRARRVLGRCGFRRVTSGPGGAHAVRNQLGPLGNLLLHLGIVVALAGGGLSAIPGSVFIGRTRLTEGESFRGTSAEYVEGAHSSVPGTLTSGPGFNVRGIEARAVGDLPPDTLRVIVGRDGRLPVVFSAATPWLYGPATMVAAEDFSYTPELSLIPSGAVTPVARVAPEMSRARSGVEESAEATAGKSRYRVTVRLVQDETAGTGDRHKVTATLAERRPDGGWRLEAEPATLSVGSPAKLGKMWLRLDAVRPNVLVRVTRVPAMPLVALAILLAAAGVALRLVFPRTEVSVHANGEALAVSVSIDAYRDGSRLVLRLARAWREEEAA